MTIDLTTNAAVVALAICATLAWLGWVSLRMAKLRSDASDTKR